MLPQSQLDDVRELLQNARLMAGNFPGLVAATMSQLVYADIVLKHANVTETWFGKRAVPTF